MSDNFEAALAVAAGAPVPSAPASTATPAAPPPADNAGASTDSAAPPTDDAASGTAAPPPPAKPRVDADTLERLRQRQRQKAQAKPQTDDRELEDFRAWKAQQAARAEHRPGIDPDMLRRDPVKALEAAGVDVEKTLNLLTKHAVTPDTASLEARVEARLSELVEENKTLRSQIDQIRDDRLARDRTKTAQRAREQFQETTSDATKYPSLAKLSPDKRATRGARKAQELLEEGIDDFTLDEVAQLVEADLHGELAELLGRDPYESAPSDAETTAPDGAQGRGAKPRPNTITSSSAGASAAKSRKLTEAERFEAALAVASRS